MTNCATYFSDANSNVTDYLKTQTGDLIVLGATNTDLSATKFLCKNCSNLYYLDTTAGAKFQSCIQGTIKNCLVYTSKFKCAACSKGYQVFSSSNTNKATQYDTCVLTPQDNICDNYTYDFKTVFGKTTLASSLIEATCAKCSIANGQIISTDVSATFENYNTGLSMAECRLVEKITNCVVYGSYTSFTGVANDQIRYGCSMCLPNYYLNPSSSSLFTISANVSYISDSCLVRTYMDSNCL